MEKEEFNTKVFIACVAFTMMALITAFSVALSVASVGELNRTKHYNAFFESIKSTIDDGDDEHDVYIITNDTAVITLHNPSCEFCTNNNEIEENE